MTFSDFVVYWYDYYRKNTFQRRGQSLMNALYYKRPELYSAVHNSNHDPFYQDKNLAETLDYLSRNW